MRGNHWECGIIYQRKHINEGKTLKIWGLLVNTAELVFMQISKLAPTIDFR